MRGPPATKIVWWEQVEKRARRAAAAQLMAGADVHPSGLAAEILQRTTHCPTTSQLQLLEGYIRRQLPGIRIVISELQGVPLKP